jgi:hypothetical protein
MLITLARETATEFKQKQIAREQKAMATNDNIIALNLLNLRANSNNDEAWLINDRADRELLIYTQKAMRQRLAAARDNGKHGWWSDKLTESETLKNQLYRALDENDLISVINYAAMLHTRKLADNFNTE